MKVGIMQPYFLPYLGYWQLIKAVDTFVVYDNIEYTKKGWINRNRILTNGKDSYITVPLEKASDYLNICDRRLSAQFDRKKLLNQISGAYRKAPHFNLVIELLDRIVNFDDDNLFVYIHHSIMEICTYLNITTNIVISSAIAIDHNLKSKDKVIAICKALSGAHYINAIGGQELYIKDEFEKENIKLSFIKMEEITYKQFDNEFIPYLSIVDVMMFSSPQEINRMLDNYNLVCRDEVAPPPPEDKQK